MWIVTLITIWRCAYKVILKFGVWEYWQTRESSLSYPGTRPERQVWEYWQTRRCFCRIHPTCGLTSLSVVVLEIISLRKRPISFFTFSWYASRRSMRRSLRIYCRRSPPMSVSIYRTNFIIWKSQIILLRPFGIRGVRFGYQVVICQEERLRPHPQDECQYWDRYRDLHRCRESLWPP